MSKESRMEEEGEEERTKVALTDLVDLALCTPEPGAVNFNLLRSLLHGLIQKLDIVDTKAEILDEGAEQVYAALEAKADELGVDLPPSHLPNKSTEEVEEQEQDEEDEDKEEEEEEEEEEGNEYEDGDENEEGETATSSRRSSKKSVGGAEEEEEAYIVEEEEDEEEEDEGEEDGEEVEDETEEGGKSEGDVREKKKSSTGSIKSTPSKGSMKTDASKGSVKAGSSKDLARAASTKDGLNAESLLEEEPSSKGSISSRESGLTVEKSSSVRRPSKLTSLAESRIKSRSVNDTTVSLEASVADMIPTITSKDFKAITDKLGKLEEKLDLVEFAELAPKVHAACQAVESMDDVEVSSMWHQLQLNKRVDANDEGVGRLSDLMDDVMRKIKDLRTRLDKVELEQEDTVNLSSSVTRVSNDFTAMREQLDALYELLGEDGPEQVVLWPILERELEAARVDLADLRDMNTEVQESLLKASVSLKDDEQVKEDDGRTDEGSEELHRADTEDESRRSLPADSNRESQPLHQDNDDQDTSGNDYQHLSSAGGESPSDVDQVPPNTESQLPPTNASSQLPPGSTGLQPTSSDGKPTPSSTAVPPSVSGIAAAPKYPSAKAKAILNKLGELIVTQRKVERRVAALEAALAGGVPLDITEQMKSFQDSAKRLEYLKDKLEKDSSASVSTTSSRPELPQIDMSPLDNIQEPETMDLDHLQEWLNYNKMRMEGLEQALVVQAENIKNFGDKLGDQMSGFRKKLERVEGELAGMLGRLAAVADKSSSEEEISALRETYGQIQRLQEDVEDLSKTSQHVMTTTGKKEDDIQSLLNAVAELRRGKADKAYLEDLLGVKADRHLVENKVSRVTFETTLQEVNAGLGEVSEKLIEQDMAWQDTVDDIQYEMDNKLDRGEIKPIKNFVNTKLKKMAGRLRKLEMLEDEPDALGTRKKVIRNLNCISCDRKVAVSGRTAGPQVPLFDCFPAHRTNRAYLTYGLEAVRKLQRQRGVSVQDLTRSFRHDLARHKGKMEAEVYDILRRQRKSCPRCFRSAADCMCYVNRYCGGSHTKISRRTRPWFGRYTPGARGGDHIDVWRSSPSARENVPTPRTDNCWRPSASARESVPVTRTNSYDSKTSGKSAGSGGTKRSAKFREGPLEGQVSAPFTKPSGKSSVPSERTSWASEKVAPSVVRGSGTSNTGGTNRPLKSGSRGSVGSKSTRKDSRLLELSSNEVEAEDVEMDVGGDIRSPDGEPMGSERQSTAGESVRGDRQSYVGESVTGDRQSTAGESVRGHRQSSTGESVRGDRQSSVGESVRGDRPSVGESVTGDRQSIGESVRGDRQSSGGESVREDRQPSGGESVRGDRHSSGGESVRADRQPSIGESMRGSRQSSLGELVRGDRQSVGESVRGDRQSSGGETVGGDRQSSVGESVRSDRQSSVGELMRGGRQSVGESVRGSRQSSVGETVRGDRQSSVGESVRGGRQSSVGESARGDRQSSIGESVRGSRHSSITESVRGGRQSSVGESVRGSRHSSIGESVRGGRQSSVGESVRGSRQSSIAKSVKASSLGRLHSVGQDDNAVPPLQETESAASTRRTSRHSDGAAAEESLDMEARSKQSRVFSQDTEIPMPTVDDLIPGTESPRGEGYESSVSPPASAIGTSSQKPSREASLAEERMSSRKVSSLYDDGEGYEEDATPIEGNAEEMEPTEGEIEEGDKTREQGEEVRGGNETDNEEEEEEEEIEEDTEK